MLQLRSAFQRHPEGRRLGLKNAVGTCQDQARSSSHVDKRHFGDVTLEAILRPILMPEEEPESPEGVRSQRKRCLPSVDEGTQDAPRGERPE